MAWLETWWSWWLMSNRVTSLQLSLSPNFLTHLLQSLYHKLNQYSSAMGIVTVNRVSVILRKERNRINRQDHYDNRSVNTRSFYIQSIRGVHDKISSEITTKLIRSAKRDLRQYHSSDLTSRGYDQSINQKKNFLFWLIMVWPITQSNMYLHSLFGWVVSWSSSCFYAKIFSHRKKKKKKEKKTLLCEPPFLHASVLSSMPRLYNNLKPVHHSWSSANFTGHLISENISCCGTCCLQATSVSNTDDWKHCWVDHQLIYTTLAQPQFSITLVEIWSHFSWLLDRKNSQNFKELDWSSSILILIPLLSLLSLHSVSWK